MPLVRAGDRRVDEIGSLNERPDHPGKHIGDYYREALPLKLLDQAVPATVATYPVVFTGWVGSCRVDRDSVHTQYCCHKMRVHSIAFPLLHRRQWDLRHRWYKGEEF